MYQNRKARRDFAKLAKMHRIKQNAPLKEQFEMTSAAIKAGRQLHMKFVEDSDNNQVKAQKIKNAAIIESFVKSGFTVKEAKAIVERNRKIEERRHEQLWARRNRTRGDDTYRL